MRVAVTGASGFIGRGTMESFAAAGVACRGLSRSGRPSWLPPEAEWAQVPTYLDAEALADGLADVECVIHLAADPRRQAGQDQDESKGQASALANAMLAKGIDKLVFASSVYARPDLAREGGPYGAAKRAVEQQLFQSGLQTIVLRLPPVYGPGGKAGITKLARLVAAGFPVPLGAAKAERAYLSRYNLSSLLVAIARADQGQWQAAAGRIFEPSDGVTVSTTDLIRHLASALGKKPPVIGVPQGFLTAVAVLIGQETFVRSAFVPLEVASPAELERTFGWRPVEQMPQSLRFLQWG